MVEYTLRDLAPPKITCFGSQIPSISVFVDWKRHRSHSICDIGYTQIDDFLNAGKCKDAPVSELSDWGGVRAWAVEA
jgi:hypothetical protein